MTDMRRQRQPSTHLEHSSPLVQFTLVHLPLACKRSVRALVVLSVVLFQLLLLMDTPAG